MTDTERAEKIMQFIYALRSKGVTDARVLRAMERIDRAVFMRGIFSERAYEDTPLPIACGQTISQPSVVALMTQALDVSPRDKVLEVGTGSGYQAAILAHLARRQRLSGAVGDLQSVRLLINLDDVERPVDNVEGV